MGWYTIPVKMQFVLKLFKHNRTVKFCIFYLPSKWSPITVQIIIIYMNSKVTRSICATDRTLLKILLRERGISIK